MEREKLCLKTRNPREGWIDLIFQVTIFDSLSPNGGQGVGVVCKNMPTPSRVIRIWAERGSSWKKGLSLGSWS